MIVDQSISVSPRYDVENIANPINHSNPWGSGVPEVGYSFVVFVDLRIPIVFVQERYCLLLLDVVVIV